MRQLALDILMRIEKQGGFSHLLISDALQKSKVSEKDANLLTEIIYGTIERKLTLDFYLQSFLRDRKIDDWVMMLLRLSVFQMVYLDKVPNYAVINEAVNIAKKRGHQGIASFVNGVLRNLVRKGVPNIRTIEDERERLSIETSHPKWLVDRWVDQYGFDITEKMCRTNVIKKPISIRVNQLKTTREAVLEKLKHDGIEASFSPYVNDGILINKGNILKTDLVEKGLVTIQDQSSMLAARSLQVEAKMNVLDTCSAPGGKATYLGELMENRGEIRAYDLHLNKTKLIKKNAKRLELTNIHVGQHDARELQSIHEKGSFDRILIDAPCSGLGVLRSKPDIKYRKKLKDIYTLHDVQYAILTHVAPLLKRNGKLVYSTCTVETLENEEVIQRFLDYHIDYQVDPTFLTEIEPFSTHGAKISKYGIQLFPQTMNADGFFITRLERLR